MHNNQNISQTEKAVLGLRGLIVHGQLRPGERVLEQILVERFGVSRTPARAAIQQICEEGYISYVPKRGYVVSSFTEEDVFDAIAIRGTIEGMAARVAAEKGVPPKVMAAMRDCLHRIDEVLTIADINVRQSEYAVLNDQMHDLICVAAQSAMITRALKRLSVIPFSLNNSFTDVPPSAENRVAEILVEAQAQHHGIIDAIERREGARAEALTKEHSRSTWKYTDLMLHLPEEVELPGVLGTAIRSQPA